MKLTVFCRGTSGLGLFVLFIMGFPLFSFSQKEKHYTLDELIHATYVNYPYGEQLKLSESQKQESVKDLDMEWLPQFSVSGKMTYQSEIYSLKMPESVTQNLGLNISDGKKLQIGRAHV